MERWYTLSLIKGQRAERVTVYAANTQEAEQEAIRRRPDHVPYVIGIRDDNRAKWRRTWTRRRSRRRGGIIRYFREMHEADRRALSQVGRLDDRGR
jgi:hypothetical protein